MVTAKLFLIIIFHITVVTEYAVCSEGQVRICYFNALARYRNESVRFDADDIDYSLCTIYVYGYARTWAYYNIIQPMDPSVEPNKAYSLFTGRRSYKDVRRNVTLLLSVGGANDSQTKELSELMYSEERMHKFSIQVSYYLRFYIFDGIDFDWQYPTTSCMKWSFVKLLEILRQTFNLDVLSRRFLITVKCPAEYNNIGYDAAAISRFADYVIVAAYDLPSPNPKQAWFGSALYSQQISVHSAINSWIRAGLRASKTVLGISPVGRFLRLQSESEFKPGSPIRNEVLKGDHFKIPNGLAYPEICELFKNGTKYHDKATEMDYLVSGTNWVGYEDTESIEAKVYWTNVMGMAGIMFSAIDMDDFTGEKCSRGRFPLLHMIKEAMEPTEITRPLGLRASQLNKAYRQKCSQFFTIALLCHLYAQCY